MEGQTVGKKSPISNKNDASERTEPKKDEFWQILITKEALRDGQLFQTWYGKNQVVLFLFGILVRD